MSETRNVVIIGSGCAGHTAALYAARANLKPLVVEGHEPGGQLSLTTLVENFPGFPEGIMGPQLVENMRKQAERFGAEYRLAHLTSVDLSKRPFLLHLGVHQVHAQALIIASGASARWLGLPNEQKLIGHGDSAMEEATFLTRFATKVTLIHRRSAFRASKIMLERARKNPKIEFLTDTVVEDVYDHAKQEVTSLKLKNVKTGKVWDFPTSALFLGIGHDPNAKMFAGQVETDADGYIKTHNYVHTRVHGVYACGDVQDRRYRQAITAAGTGCMAAIEAERFLEEHGS